MATTVHLHVGIAKTGTTYLQRRLFANRKALARHGTLYPGDRPGAHFFASLDLRNVTFKGHEYPQAAGAWQRLVDEVAQYDGAALISHETLAHAFPAQIARAVGAFGAAEVKVIVTARDLVRQLPAVWQESLKNRGTSQFESFLTKTIDAWPPTAQPKRGFWSTQDVAALVERWADVVGLERVTVVTVPPAGADRSLLWTRFAAAAELPEIEFVSPSANANTSLGVAEAEVLRRLNPLFDDVLDWPAYDARIKKRLAEHVLAHSRVSGALTLPEHRISAVHDISATLVERLSASGVSVVGELSDLAGSPVPDAGPQPSELSDADVLAAALAALAAISAEPRRQPATVRKAFRDLVKNAKLTRRLRRQG